MKKLHHLQDFFGLEFGLVGRRGALERGRICGRRRRLEWKGREKGMNKRGKDLRE